MMVRARAGLLLDCAVLEEQLKAQLCNSIYNIILLALELM